jgi:hypothetical protein
MKWKQKEQHKVLIKISSFLKRDKIEKSLPKLTKRNRDKTQLCKVRGKKGDIITDTTEIQRLTREYFEKLFANKLENPETDDLPKLNQ